jgi:hypothetical protein
MHWRVYTGYYTGLQVYTGYYTGLHRLLHRFTGLHRLLHRFTGLHRWLHRLLVLLTGLHHKYLGTQTCRGQRLFMHWRVSFCAKWSNSWDKSHFCWKTYRQVAAFFLGLPDFSRCLIPKPEKMYQNNTYCTQWSWNIPNLRKILRRDIKYNNIFQSSALQNLPKLVFFDLKINHLATLYRLKSRRLRNQGKDKWFLFRAGLLHSFQDTWCHSSLSMQTAPLFRTKKTSSFLPQFPFFLTQVFKCISFVWWEA